MKIHKQKTNFTFLSTPKGGVNAGNVSLGYDCCKLCEVISSLPATAKKQVNII